MITFVLVHGAWHGAWCWKKVTPLLEANGNRVLVPDLPGHGVDKTPPATVTLDDYVKKWLR
ncbi:alpha/beta fold hydrolase [Spirosoma arcticum]